MVAVVVMLGMRGERRRMVVVVMPLMLQHLAPRRRAHMVLVRRLQVLLRPRHRGLMSGVVRRLRRVTAWVHRRRGHTLLLLRRGVGMVLMTVKRLVDHLG